MEFSEIKSRFNNDILDKTAFSKSGNKFCSYTRAGAAEKIMTPMRDCNYFFVSSIKDMNDQNEAELHKDTADRVYALCFCNTDTESIPLWYLYGGIIGKGIRISLTGTKMWDIINSLEEVYPVSNNIPDTDHPLIRGKDFEFQYGWVTYRETKSGNRFIYREDHGIMLPQDKADFSENYFIKDYEWNYEKEFRLVFIFKNQPAGKIAVKFDKNKLIKSRGLKIKTAPNYTDNENEIGTIAEKLGIPPERIETSKLNIKFNLLKINLDDILKTVSDKF